MNLFGHDLMAQVNRELVALANPIGGTGSYRIRELLRMNLSVFTWSEVEEDPNGLLEQVYKTLAIMGLTSMEKVELLAYQLKDVAQISYEQWKILGY